MKKISCYVVGAVFAVMLISGVIVCFLPKGVALGIGIALICLSIAFGMLTVNPGFAFTLASGIIMVVLPPWLSGIIFIALSLCGMVINIPTSIKQISGC